MVYAHILIRNQTILIGWLAVEKHNLDSRDRSLIILLEMLTVSLRPTSKVWPLFFTHLFKYSLQMFEQKVKSD